MAALSADELAQRHNTIIKDLIHDQSDLLLTLKHLQELRTDLAQAGDGNSRIRELASMAALNQVEANGMYYVLGRFEWKIYEGIHHRAFVPIPPGCSPVLPR